MRTAAPLLRVIALGLPHWRLTLAATAAGFATVASGIGLLGCAAFIIASAAFHPSIAELQVAIVGVRFFGIARSVFRYLERVASHRLSLRLLTRLRTWFYAALEPLAPARCAELRSGDLLTRSVGDVETLQELYVRSLAPPIVAATTVAATATLLATFDPAVAATVLAFHLGAGVALPLLLVPLGRRSGRRLVEARGALGTAVVDSLQGMADLLAFDADRTHLARLDALSADHARSRSSQALLSGAHAAAGLLLAHGAMWSVLVLAIPMVRNGRLDGVSLAVMALVALASFEAVQPLATAAQSLEQHRQAARRVLEAIDATPAITESPEPEPMTGTTPAIELRGVSFAYPSCPGQVLEDISFCLPPGSHVALVGPTGAGKSTVAHLLLRFWDPTEGAILADGRDLRRLSLADLRRKVGLLSQDTHLFTGTIRDNLLLARPDADDGALWRVLESARLAGEVEAWPDGLGTMVGEQGLRLAGGQRQRLGIARLLLHDPPVVLLDEPTADLDAITERELLAGLHAAIGGRTCLTISHRLLEMERMDEILVLADGRVVERGAHLELIAQRGLYHRLWHGQRLQLDRHGM